MRQQRGAGFDARLNVRLILGDRIGLFVQMNPGLAPNLQCVIFAMRRYLPFERPPHSHTLSHIVSFAKGSGEW